MKITQKSYAQISGQFNKLIVAWNDVDGYLKIAPKFR